MVDSVEGIGSGSSRATAMVVTDPGSASPASAFSFVGTGQEITRFDSERLADLAQERNQRKQVANWTLRALTCQLVCMNAAFVAYAIWFASTADYAITFRWFMVGTLGEIFGIMWILVSFLFPKDRPSLYQGH